MRQIGNGQFNKISSLAILSPGPATKIPEANTTFLYVADSGNDSIDKFFINGTSVLKWGSKGTFQGQFYRPTAIALVMTVYLSQTLLEGSKFLTRMAPLKLDGVLWAR